MVRFEGFIKKHAVFLLHVLITVGACFACSLFFEKLPDYLFFWNLLCALGVVYCLYRAIFRHIYADSFLKALCVMATLASANHLYSFKKLSSIFPILRNVNQKALFAGIVLFFVCLLLILKLLTYIEPVNAAPPRQRRRGIDDREITDPPGTASDGGRNEVAEELIRILKRREEGESFFSFLRFLLVFVGLCIVIVLPAVLLYVFQNHNQPSKVLDIDYLFSYFVGYGAMFLLTLAVVVAAIITMIYVARYIYVILKAFKNASETDLKNTYPIPTYAISMFAVGVLMFLTWRVSNFTLDDLTQFLAAGDYLALPIASIVFFVLFYVLVQITHALILMLQQMSAEKIKTFIEKQEEKYKVADRTGKIIATAIDIILNTILATLEFVKFIPNFFVVLGSLVFPQTVFVDDDEEYALEDEDSEEYDDED